MKTVGNYHRLQPVFRQSVENDIFVARKLIRNAVAQMGKKFCSGFCGMSQLLRFRRTVPDGYGYSAGLNIGYKFSGGSGNGNQFKSAATQVE